MNDLTAIKILSNFIKRVNVTGIKEAQALIEVNQWLDNKEKQILGIAKGTTPKQNKTESKS